MNFLKMLGIDEKEAEDFMDIAKNTTYAIHNINVNIATIVNQNEQILGVLRDIKEGVKCLKK